MGKIKQGILGGFSGKVGNVIGTSWKGISVVKVMPQSVANPRTTAQVTQRNSLTLVVSFATQILAGFIKPLWDRFAQGMSGYNDFISSNIQFFSDPAAIDYSSLILSKGKLSAPEEVSLIVKNNGTLDVGHVNGAYNAYDSNNDVVYCVAYNERAGIGYTFQTGTDRQYEQVTHLNIPSLMMETGDDVHVWFAFRRVDGTMVSPAGYATAKVVAA